MGQLQQMAAAVTLINKTLDWPLDRVVFPPTMALSTTYKIWKNYEPGDLPFDQYFVFEFESIADMMKVLEHCTIFATCNVVDRMSKKEHKARALAYAGRRRVILKIND